MSEPNIYDHLASSSTLIRAGILSVTPLPSYIKTVLNFPKHTFKTLSYYENNIKTYNEIVAMEKSAQKVVADQIASSMCGSLIGKPVAASVAIATLKLIQPTINRAEGITDAQVKMAVQETKRHLQEGNTIMALLSSNSAYETAKVDSAVKGVKFLGDILIKGIGVLSDKINFMMSVYCDNLVQMVKKYNPSLIGSAMAGEMEESYPKIKIPEKLPEIKTDNLFNIKGNNTTINFNFMDTFFDSDSQFAAFTDKLYNAMLHT